MAHLPCLLCRRHLVPSVRRERRVPRGGGAARQRPGHWAAGWMCPPRVRARMRVLVFPVVVIIIAPAEWSLLSVAAGLCDGSCPALLRVGHIILQLLQVAAGFSNLPGYCLAAGCGLLQSLILCLMLHLHNLALLLQL